MPDKEKIIENYVEPDIIVEYIFIEKADKQIKPINDDQGYQMGFFDLFISGQFKNNNLTAFKDLLLDEINYSVKTYDHFKSERVDLKDYKFGIVDYEKNVKVFDLMDEEFFNTLISSIRNLMIVGKNFDIEKFKEHQLLDKWFNKFSNRV